jgi:hypothetical protein
LVGAIGFLLGFAAWLFWLLLAVTSFIYHPLGFGYFGSMSGIFFQSWILGRIFYSLLAISLALESFGCFALKQKYGSKPAFACGVLLLAFSAAVISSMIIPTYHPLVYNPVVSLNVGLLALGVTFLLIRKALPTPRKALWIGLLFILIPAFTLNWFLFVILYFGFEIWLMLLGWLYAINSVFAGCLMLQIRNTQANA